MHTSLLLLATLLAQPSAPHFERRVLTLPDGSGIRYGLAVPADYVATRPRALVIALHPGGSSPYYGDGFMRSIFWPGLRELGPIMVAPDVVGRNWTDPASDRAVLALAEAISKEFAIDRQRIVVTGFSMGGAGTWHFSARHPARFTAAIVMAGRTEEPPASLAKIPTYVIHSRRDEVVPFQQAADRVKALEGQGKRVRFEALADVGHYEMSEYVDALARGGRWIAEQWGR